MSATIVEGKNRKYLQFALEVIARAEAIINDYLNFSKPRLTKYEKFSLSDLIENVTKLLMPLASYRGIQFDSGMEDQIYMHTDRGQLQQALVNLIKNAMEASIENDVVQVKLE